MAVTLETLHQEMKHMRDELHLVRHILEEDCELSDDVKQKLEAARKTPLSEYIDHSEVKKILSK